MKTPSKTIGRLTVDIALRPVATRFEVVLCDPKTGAERVIGHARLVLESPKGKRKGGKA